MKFLYVTDIHGVEWKLDALLDYALANQIELILNGGDLYPKEKPYHRTQREFLLGPFRRHLKQCSQHGLKVLLIPGNDDLACFDSLLNQVLEECSGCYIIARRKVSIEGHEFIGFDLVKDPPFTLKDRCRRDLDQEHPATLEGYLSTERGFLRIRWEERFYAAPSLAEELERLPEPEDPSRAVYIIHQPPFGMGLSLTYSRRDAGSVAVREFLSRVQPLASFHGHIHESVRMTGKWKERLGRTLCVQPGQEWNLTFVAGHLEDPSSYQLIEIPHPEKHEP